MADTHELGPFDTEPTDELFSDEITLVKQAILDLIMHFPEIPFWEDNDIVAELSVDSSARVTNDPQVYAVALAELIKENALQRLENGAVSLVDRG